MKGRKGSGSAVVEPVGAAAAVLLCFPVSLPAAVFPEHQLELPPSSWAVVEGDTAVARLTVSDEPATGNLRWELLVYERPGAEGVWEEVFRVVPSASSSPLGFGGNVYLSGDTMAVNGDFAIDNRTGLLKPESIYLFERGAGGNTDWAEVRVLRDLGFLVGLSGDVLLVGGGFDQDPSGAVRARPVHLHVRDEGGAGAWGRVVTRVPPEGLGSGRAVVDGETLVLGGTHTVAPGNGALTDFPASVFRRGAGGVEGWGQVARLVPADGASTGAIALSGDRAAAGGTRVNPDTGRAERVVFLFERAAGTDDWTEVGLVGPVGGVEDLGFGQDIALSDDTLMVSGRAPSTPGLPGIVYVYHRRPDGAWIDAGVAAAPDPAAGDGFGARFFLDGETAAVVASNANRTGVPSRPYLLGVGFGDTQVRGEVWEDADGNGLRGADEALVPGVPVYLDLDGDGALGRTVRNYTASGLPLTIPPRATAIVEVAGPVLDAPVLDVNVGWDFDASGTPGALSVTAVSPAGTRVLLFDGTAPAGGEPDFAGTVADDEARVGLGAAAPPRAGSFRPLEALAAFAGEALGGRFILEVHSLSGGELTAVWFEVELPAEPAGISRPDGTYVIGGLEVGDYAVRAAPPLGHLAGAVPAGGAHAVQLTAEGEVLGGRGFGLAPAPPAEDYLAWRERVFGPAGADPAVGGALADPDGDGLPNLWTYLNGSTPGDAHRANPLVRRSGGGGATGAVPAGLVYRLGLSATGYTVIAERSTDLGGWTTLNRPHRFVGAEDGRWVFEVPLPAGDSEFFRLRARDGAEP